jgi:hypothetical protein
MGMGALAVDDEASVFADEDRLEMAWATLNEGIGPCCNPEEKRPPLA